MDVVMWCLVVTADTQECCANELVQHFHHKNYRFNLKRGRGESVYVQLYEDEEKI